MITGIEPFPPWSKNMVIKKRIGKKEIVIDYSKTTSNLADGKEAANNVKAKGKNDVNESKDERDKVDKEISNESEDSADETAEAVTESYCDDDIEEDLDICYDFKDDGKDTSDEDEDIGNELSNNGNGYNGSSIDWGKDNRGIETNESLEFDSSISDDGDDTLQDWGDNLSGSVGWVKVVWKKGKISISIQMDRLMKLSLTENIDLHTDLNLDIRKDSSTPTGLVTTRN